MKTFAISCLASSAMAALSSNETQWVPAIGEELCKNGCRDLAIHSKMNKVMPLIQAHVKQCHASGACPIRTHSKRGGVTKCVNGKAGEYPCDGVDMVSFLSIGAMGGGDEGNDIWGWTDEKTGAEWAVVGLTDGTSFVDISDAENPKAVAFLPTQTSASTWRDVKVYKGHAYVVSEARNHGMQVVDMRKLGALSAAAAVGAAPATIAADVVYTEFGNSHNIVINEQTGFGYSVGTQTCSGGLHMIDLKDPANPTFAGCSATGGYCHDAECVVYDGPDKQHAGKEICFNYNEDKLVIEDVSDKKNIKTISTTPYVDNKYTHQGWLSKDQSMVLMNDELDELQAKSLNSKTRTMVWNLNSLAKPVHATDFMHPANAIDHNLYIDGDLAYLSNYGDGLVVMDLSAVKDAKITRAAHFDCAQETDTSPASPPVFSGTWSNYPYYKSGVVVVNSIEKGLFILKVQDGVKAQVAANAAAWEKAQLVQVQPTVAMSGAAATHYGDPLAGPCMSDEQNITITGVAGSVCSPAATGGKCPTDTPAGCTITPAAILQDQSGDKYCALECSPSLPIKDQKLADSICGVDNMSCKPISGVGICTYDA
jgi:choice-of-anchor B domain-containing protein